uniref:BMA-COL-173 n=1 Tax=Brugia malayi TaxID=6279 RepID=A0A0J9Y2G9_BRUMA|nr:BMA-COL-173 [Brugia malayi]
MVNDIERIRERLLYTEKLKYLAFFGVATSAFIAIDRSLELFKRLSERNLKQKREGNFDQEAPSRNNSSAASCKCEYGPSGPAGPKGRDGKNGVDGLPGSNGIPGIDGDVIVAKGTDFCFECPPGDAGSPGPVGPKGPPDIPGVPGLNADGGERSPPGLPGLPGQAGPKGQPGIDGHIVKQPEPPDFQDEKLQYNMMLSGPQGPVGTPGVQGLPGIPGHQVRLILIFAEPLSEQDPPRDPGIPGLDGCPGFPGKKGTTGKRGPSESCVHCPNPRTAPGY